MMTEKNWYAINTKEHWNKKIIETLQRKKIDAFYPLTRLSEKTENRKQLSFFRPLFPNLLFANISISEINLVKQTEGVMHFLYWLGDYAIISKDDIHAIRVFIDLYKDVKIEKSTTIRTIDQLTLRHEEFSLDEYNSESKTEKLFLPTLGYFLMAQPETINEVFHHAI